MQTKLYIYSGGEIVEEYIPEEVRTKIKKYFIQRPKYIEEKSFD